VVRGDGLASWFVPRRQSPPEEGSNYFFDKEKGTPEAGG
jgi:hypothetical protein